MKFKRESIYMCLSSFLLVMGCTETTEQPQAEEEVAVATSGLDRSSLPIADPVFPKVTELDARNATAPPPFSIEAPDGAPNIVVVLIDDIGFGASDGFGGAIKTPTLNRLADDGLRFNQFHTTALCSPTRMAILTGRNHHSANAGSVMEVATAFQGNRGQRPLSVAPVTEMLRLNGYSTAAFGKYHETAPWEVSVSGPFDRWPTGSGFDHFYGFIGGETNQFAPVLHNGTAPVTLDEDPDYHFTTDMTNQTIAWIRSQQSLTPDKPFFVYFATGATHAPHQVPADWVDRYKGQFDDGWDVYREETLARQIELGVVPEGTKLASKPDAIEDWDSLSEEEQQLYALQMEVFAAFAEHTDHEVGRLVDSLEEIGELDNTLFIYVFGDNGSSAEGGLTGTFNETTALNGIPVQVEDQLKFADEWGGPTSYPHFQAGWAVATNTPFQWTKQVASHYGGTRNPVVVHWPAGIKAKGEVRSQWHHVTDLAPTLMEAAGLPFPNTVNGIVQKPFEGVSMIYAFDEIEAEDRHTKQYFEMFGNRAIYHEGWVAAAKHRTPWASAPDGPLDQDNWELYHVAEDFSQANDLSASHPDKLQEMQALFIEEAIKYDVLPLDDRVFERFNASIAGRPDLMGKRTSLTVYPGMAQMTENAFINVKNRSHSITADVEIPEDGAEGVIMAQGGRFAGWSLYMKDSKVSYVHNWVGLERYTITSKEALAPGMATIRYEFDYVGGKPGSGGTGTIYVNGEKVGEGKIVNTTPFLFSADETADVGQDIATPVTEAYAEGDNKFTGTIEKITVELH